MRIAATAPQMCPHRKSQTPIAAFLASFLSLSFLASTAAIAIGDETGPKTLAADSGPGKGILIDGIHANDLSTVCLEPRVYEYHATTGYRRAFEYLRSRGVNCDRATEGQLDAKRLSPYRLLFVNLVSAERPPLLVSEIAAIRQFVAGGGSLFVVTDHTNAYFHAHALKPLFTELGIETRTDTACDVAPHTLGNGNGWIAVTRFKPHPVTDGLKCLGVQTGGSVDARFAVALTSDRSWADAWRTGPYGEENSPGFFGNFRRDPGEAAGPLGVVMAKDFGRGRILVVGDQNMLGACFMNYADNYRLWLNSVAWLLDEPRLAQPEPYEQWRSPRVVCYERFDRSDWGSSEISGSYHAWVLLSRHYWAFANDRLSGPCDLMLFAYNDLALPDDVAASAAAHLRRGKNVLVLGSESQTLWDEPGVLGQILKAMGVSSPKTHAEKEKLVVELPTAGRIHVLNSSTILDNGVIPSPHASDTQNAPACKLLLDAVKEAIPGMAVK